MRAVQSSHGYGKSLLMSLIAVALMMLAAVPVVMAAPVAIEETISIQRIGRHPDVLDRVTSRLTVPPHVQWETDPDAGPLTVSVETGALGVMLGGGSARIERRPDPLLGGHIGPLQPGRQTVLWPGDRLMVVRGFQLVVTNDEDAPASAIVMRLHRGPAANG